ncbi:MAG: OmpA family protein [Candidatus Kapaibacterium sp.]
MKKAIIILTVLFSILPLISEEDRGTMVDYNPLPNNDTLVVTRWYGDLWFGAGVTTQYNQYFGDFFAPGAPSNLAHAQFNPEFLFENGTGFGYSLGAIFEYNPISSPYGGFLQVNYLKRRYNSETDEVVKPFSTAKDIRYVLESTIEYIEIRPAFRYDFGFLNMYGYAGPGVDINIGQNSTHYLKFVHTGDIAQDNIYKFNDIKTRFYLHFGVGLDLFLTDLNGTRFRFSPYIAADFGTDVLGTQNGGLSKSAVNMASARLGVSLKLGRDHKLFDTLRFDPNYKGPDYQVAVMDNNVNLKGDLKDNLLNPTDIAYFDLPEPIEIVREEPDISRESTNENDFKPIKLETNRMKFYEFTTSESTQLTSELKNYLDNVARYLTENPGAEIRIVGHSDNMGSAEENQRRSVIRKDRVVRYLLAKGINRYRILDRGEGDRKPIADTRTAEGRKKNRRVEITIIQ